MTWRAIAVMAVAAGIAGAQQGPPPNQQAVQQGLEALFKAMSSAQQQGAPAALIDHRELKSLLPATLKGFRRTSASSERSGALGMTISRAEGVYEGANDARIEIEYSDLGGLGGLGAFAQAAWVGADIDRETDRGFERTTKYKGHKAHEEYDNEDKSGKLEVLLGGRLMVTVRGYRVKLDELRAAMDQIDLAKLAALKPVESKQTR
ncbi:MAG: hypothetical protein N2652_11445 [Kiritimatiellae bacterium]|nr:hypothetical protein [Kiritimatiellia bacterium]